MDAPEEGFLGLNNPEETPTATGQSIMLPMEEWWYNLRQSPSLVGIFELASNCSLWMDADGYEIGTTSNLTMPNPCDWWLCDCQSESYCIQYRLRYIYRFEVATLTKSRSSAMHVMMGDGMFNGEIVAEDEIIGVDEGMNQWKMYWRISWSSHDKSLSLCYKNQSINKIYATILQSINAFVDDWFDSICWFPHDHHSYSLSINI